MTCPPEGYLLMTSPSGQIASSVVHETNIGGPRCPVRIKLPPYQRLNLSMIDFSVALPQSDRWGYHSQPPEEHYHEPWQQVTCDQQSSSGFIVDRNGSQSGHNNISLCAGVHANTGSHSRRRKTSIYRSKGNVVDVVIYPQTDSRFLLMYHGESIGATEEVIQCFYCFYSALFSLSLRPDFFFELFSVEL